MISDTDSKTDCYLSLNRININIVTSTYSSLNVSFIIIIYFFIIIWGLKYYLVCQEGHEEYFLYFRKIRSPKMWRVVLKEVRLTTKRPVQKLF